MLFFSVHTHHTFHKNINLFSTLIIITVFWAANQPIKIISEGSCVNEDWSNDAENTALKQEKHLKISLIYCIFGEP